MGLSYRVGGRTANTAATADNVGAALWNPHATKDIYLRELHWFQTAATVSNPGLVRISARGTASASVTPDIDNDDLRLLAPISGAILDITYSAQPTVSTPYLHRTNLPAAIGSGFIWVFVGLVLRIAAGWGIAVATPVAVILQASDVTVVWEE